MSYWLDPTHCEAYVKIAEGYDGREIITELQKHLPAGSRVLELGMGPGVDSLLLAEHYQVVGSDLSQWFVERMQKLHPEIDTMVLDAISIKTEQMFDGIYSNKVLQCLKRDELRQSFKRQYELIAKGGVLCHTFWYGDEEELVEGARCIYYNEDTITETFSNDLDVLKISRYTEMSKDDSLLVILRK